MNKGLTVPAKMGAVVRLKKYPKCSQKISPKLSAQAQKFLKKISLWVFVVRAPRHSTIWRAAFEAAAVIVFIAFLSAVSGLLRWKPPFAQ